MENNQCINFLLTKAQQSVFSYFKNKLDEFDVTPVQYGILNCLWCNDGLTASQIAHNLSLDGSTITGILDRMENKELLMRVPDPNDRRAIRVVLTEKGFRLRNPIEKVVEEANQFLLSVFSQKEQAQFHHFLEMIAEHINSF